MTTGRLGKVAALLLTIAVIAAAVSGYASQAVFRIIWDSGRNPDSAGVWALICSAMLMGIAVLVGSVGLVIGTYWLLCRLSNRTSRRSAAAEDRADVSP